jgi:hypothetical protein
MERIGHALRQRGMMSSRHVRGIVVSGLLCAAVAACGTQAATASSGVQAASSTSSAPAVGCAALDQATSVDVHRTQHLIEPAKTNTLIKAQTNKALVRALLSDYCKIAAHPYAPTTPVNCPMAFGVAYSGTFYDGHRVLATFTDSASGCQSITLTVAGKVKHSLVMGPAATLAPHLDSDLAAVLGLPESSVFNPVKGGGPVTNVNPGGPNKPA